MSNKIQIRVPIFPLNGVELAGEYKIADHVNLSGKGIRETGFVPITDLYLDKHDPSAITVVCLKSLTRPTDEEAKILKDNGIKAYTYELIEPALYAAANGQTVEAVGYVPKLPEGFSCNGISSGIKESKRKDLGIIHSDTDAVWAGVFTKNLVKADCVTNNQAKLGQKIKNIFVNSGNANACTGEQGNKDDHRIAELVSSKLGGQTLTASTGKIGVTLNMAVIKSGIQSVILSPKDEESQKRRIGDPSTSSQDDKTKSQDDIINFAEAILTTDLRIKISQDPKQYMLGFTKGSGMIHPNMATMLGFIISDIRIKDLSEEEHQSFFQKSLQEITEKTFNSISVDGDTSTNDMVIFSSNLQGKEISPEEFKTALELVSRDLAYQIINDGEGTTKVLETTVTGSLEEKELRVIAKGIIGSNLVKSAMFGCDPNWGRIMASAGQVASENNIKLIPEKCSLKIFGIEIYRDGVPVNQVKKAELTQLMKKNRVVPINLSTSNNQSNSVIVWGSDLSYDYVRINAEYFT